MAKMTTEEILAAIDLDAARSAHASIGSHLNSIAFSAPELIGGKLSAVAESMNELAVALCLIVPAPTKGNAGVVDPGKPAPLPPRVPPRRGLS